ncbi:MAG: CHRD domain-containing protein [Chloroflexota bacterium]|nr:CHRD domain-containing protein [Chloroflexota bacterium]MDE3194586.1 CHRD domain-containing protein [Chloroflexota bacterium]
MRATGLILGATLLLAACGGGAGQATSTPATVAGNTAAASTVTFTADMTAGNEVPAITDAEKTGSGKATITFDVKRDAAGKATSATVSIKATLTGFPTTTEITLAHIHGPAAPGVNAGVVVPFKTDANAPIALTTGGTTFTKDGVVLDKADVLQQILDDPGKFYVNFHSKLHPGGVIRGPLTKT